MGNYIFFGLVGVCNMVLWGLYADLLVEDFQLKKVFRSVLIGIFASVFLYWVNPNLPPIIVILNVVSIERLITEIYKNLIRVEPQKKYLIPSTLNWPIRNEAKRTLGVLVIVLGLVVFKVIRIDIEFWAIYLLAITPAITGAFKDAPHEGFFLFKFFRLPVVVGVIGILLHNFFPFLESKHLLFAMGGGERIISEFYKKILRGNMPGKFKAHAYNSNDGWVRKRKIILIPYFTSLILILVLFFQSLSKIP